MGSTYNGTIQFFKQIGDSPNQEVNLMTESASHSQVFKSKALYSWVYPQSSLPPSVIAAFALSAAEGVEMDFVRKRHSAWEDAFRCLYYMLRKNACNLFYVCTAQFVVMFTSSAGQDKAKISCNAFISKSTRGLRSLLKEHDVCFTMPLCPSKMEEATMEDLVELSEIEKQNLGQIQCKELKKLDHTAFTPKGSNMKNGDVQEFSSSYACSIEVKDMYLPPWMTCNLCAIMGSEGRDFEASFATEPRSAGLNFAIEALTEKSEGKVQAIKNELPTFGIADAIVAPEMCSAVLKGLKCCKNTISALFSQV